MKALCLFLFSFWSTSSNNIASLFIFAKSCNTIRVKAQFSNFLWRCVLDVWCLMYSHGIVSSSVGPEYYVGILSFVDKTQLEPGCSVLMHNKAGYRKESLPLARQLRE